MKIKTKNLSYDEVMALPLAKHVKPKKPNIFFRKLVNVVSQSDLKATNFNYTKDIERAGDGPYLILMNHSAFIDLSIASEVLKKIPYTIVCTSDGFVGKEWLMRSIGCFPTNKFVSDISLISDIRYCLNTEKCSVLMYPEASYSFDGTATKLPRRMGALLKHINVPVLMIKTEGAFSRDPLYNMLQLRKVDVSAKFSCLLSREDIKEKPVEELDRILDEAFTFDNFAWQRDEKVEICEDFRADGLERILYKCPVCGSEGEMEGKGTVLHCKHCGLSMEMDKYGQLVLVNNGNDESKYQFAKETEPFKHIPYWYAWEREQVRKEIEARSYSQTVHVDIRMLVDFKSIYNIGGGMLTHNCSGYKLVLDDGREIFNLVPGMSYSAYADYFWYEIGDMICIGDKQRLFYCFPPEGVPVAKFRLATEEMYKIYKSL